jgi:prophage regulatory protein
MTKLIRLQTVLDRTGLSRSTCYELMAAGKFCQPVKIGPRAIAFSENEVDAWINARLSEREFA